MSASNDYHEKAKAIVAETMRDVNEISPNAGFTATQLVHDVHFAMMVLAAIEFVNHPHVMLATGDLNEGKIELMPISAGFAEYFSQQMERVQGGDWEKLKDAAGQERAVVRMGPSPGMCDEDDEDCHCESCEMERASLEMKSHGRKH